MTRKFRAQVGERSVEVSVVELEGGRCEVTVGDRVRVVDARALGQRAWSLVLDGRAHTVDLEGELPELAVHFRDQSVPVKLVDARRALLAEAGRRGGHKAGPLPIRSPMPGKVVKLLAAIGTRVAAGQGLLVVEAMKMENEMRAPRDGTVVAIRVREGQTVEAGEELATLE
jgi:biotin carboxyl carrier protein